MKWLMYTVLAVSASAACAANLSPDRIDKLIRVPLTRQATDYTCGVAALQSIFGYYGEDINESDLAKKLKADTNNGTNHRHILELSKSKGYKTEIHENMNLSDLKKYIDRKLPVICLIQAWPEKARDLSQSWSDGHYVVAIGYDDKNIYFMDPSTIGNYTFIPTNKFLARWHDKEGQRKIIHFGMIISKNKSAYDPIQIKSLD